MPGWQSYTPSKDVKQPPSACKENFSVIPVCPGNTQGIFFPKTFSKAKVSPRLPWSFLSTSHLPVSDLPLLRTCEAFRTSCRGTFLPEAFTMHLYSTEAHYSFWPWPSWERTGEDASQGRLLCSVRCVCESDLKYINLSAVEERQGLFTSY